ncbi:MAG: SWIM zinc finger family protein [Lachnospiraceae bacterium]|nr:SWIM zinc finger family protein [Lachnospiraceae bacterium]
MDWRNLFADNVLKGSQQYINKGAVGNVISQNNIITGDVSGLETFHVQIEVDNGIVSKMNCSCPLAKTGANCKHMAAVLTFWENNNPGINNVVKDSIPSNLEPKEEKQEVVEEEKVEVTESKAEPVEEAAIEEQPIQVEIVETASEETNIEESYALPEKEEIEAEHVTNEPETISNPIEEKPQKEEKAAEPEKKNVKYAFDSQFVHVNHEEIEVKADVSSVFAYALYQNGTPLVKEVTIKNNSENEYKNLVIRV